MKKPYLSVSGWRKKKPSMKTVAAVEAVPAVAVTSTPTSAGS